MGFSFDPLLVEKSITEASVVSAVVCRLLYLGEGLVDRLSHLYSDQFSIFVDIGFNQF